MFFRVKIKINCSQAALNSSPFPGNELVDLPISDRSHESSYIYQNSNSLGTLIRDKRQGENNSEQKIA